MCQPTPSKILSTQTFKNKVKKSTLTTHCSLISWGTTKTMTCLDVAYLPAAGFGTWISAIVAKSSITPYFILQEVNINIFNCTSNYMY